MCTVCGCGDAHVHTGDQPYDHHHDHGDHPHPHDHDHDHAHDHSHEHPHEHTHRHHYGLGPAGLHVTGLSQARIIKIEQDILGRNDADAARNRRYFEERGILALNLVSSPGSGKTTLLERSIQDLNKHYTLNVIEGDQQTENDAERIRATGAAAVQVNTGKGCHLDARMVEQALKTLQPADHSLMFIENVGNLVCPALFDLGEAAKVVILSVTEGEDKPLKYPDMFHRAGLVLINKTDLLPHLRFDLQRCLDYVRQVNAGADILQVSAFTGEGMAQWYDWIKRKRQALLNSRIAQLEQAAATLKTQLAET
jgi:hydrogenase nickel incorporation protein HypB